MLDSMRALTCFLSVGALLWPHWAVAQMQPHRAEYALRLGVAANAARIGSAVQDLMLDCDGWRLKRDVRGEIALTASWKINVASRLESEEQRTGEAFRYRTQQSQNGAERETHGKIRRAGKDLRAEIVSPAGPAQVLLPSATLMPVALMDHMIERLRHGSMAFGALAFDAEGTGEAFLIDVTPLDRGVIRGARPTDRAVAALGRSWAVSMRFTRGRSEQQKPLFTLSAQIFESGVLDRLTAETDMAVVTADLQALEMREPPTCPQR
jgi:hypothetical protein